jgi:hypothetical protein
MQQQQQQQQGEQFGGMAQGQAANAAGFPGMQQPDGMPGSNNPSMAAAAAANPMLGFRLPGLPNFPGLPGVPGASAAGAPAGVLGALGAMGALGGNPFLQQAAAAAAAAAGGAPPGLMPGSATNPFEWLQQLMAAQASSWITAQANNAAAQLQAAAAAAAAAAAGVGGGPVQSASQYGAIGGAPDLSLFDGMGGPGPQGAAADDGRSSSGGVHKRQTAGSTDSIQVRGGSCSGYVVGWGGVCVGWEGAVRAVCSTTCVPPGFVGYCMHELYNNASLQADPQHYLCVSTCFVCVRASVRTSVRVQCAVQRACCQD